jgi:serine/threonine-protein kinase
MSPEQVEGAEVDARTDIFAFGAVLYEMLTGRRAFSGEDVSDTLAGILRGDPDWSLLPSSVSPTVRHYLKRCLVKEPSQRVRDIGDMRLALEGVFDVPAETVPVPSASTRRAWRWRLAAVGALAVAVIAGGLGMSLLSRVFPCDPSRVVRLAIVPPNGAPILPTQLDADVAISRDGTHVAFFSFEQGRLKLYVRSLDRVEAVALEGVVTPRMLFFSPDGQSIGFFDGSELKRISVNGGPVVTIAKIAGGAVGASWGDDDSIVYATQVSRGLMRIPAGGGEAVRITTGRDGQNDILPEVLPGGRAVLFTRAAGLLGGSNSQIIVVDLDSGTEKTLISGGSHARYAYSGHLVYGFAGTLRAVPFDLTTLTIRGNPVPVVDRVVTKPSGAANFALAANGSLVYESGDMTAGNDRSLVWVSRDGSEEVITEDKRPYVYPRISPDGTRVALDIRDAENDIWIWDFERRTLQRFTFDTGMNRGVVWTRDGRRLIFSAESNGLESLFWQSADRSGKPERLTTAEPGRPHVPYSITPDDSVLIHGEPGSPPFDLFTLQLNGDRKRTPLLTESYSEHNGEISPDGRWLVYQSNESGDNEIYVRRFPTLDSQAQVSTGGGTRPMWSRDGHELFYLKIDGTMMSVPVERREETGFVAGAPKRLFQGQYYAIQAGRTYDISPDGKRFLMIKDLDSRPSALQLMVVLNWVEELKRLVPND